MASTTSPSSSLLGVQDGCVNKATPIHFIDGKKLKSCRMGLTNHTGPISHYIMPLVNALEVDTQTHILMHDQK